MAVRHGPTEEGHMEVIVERILVELAAIVVQLAILRLVRWLRSRAPAIA